MGNIIQVARDARSEINLKRLEIRDARSASLIKRHITGAEIVTPAMKKIIKEEKDQGFKRQNYYYCNRNNIIMEEEIHSVDILIILILQLINLKGGCLAALVKRQHSVVNGYNFVKRGIMPIYMNKYKIKKY
jgi:hypothetical protein